MSSPAIPISGATGSESSRSNSSGIHLQYKVRDGTIRYTAPTSISCSSNVAQAIEDVNAAVVNDDECPICCDELSRLPMARLKKCAHIFHRDCLQKCMNREPKCPVCRSVVGSHQGRSPSGTMTISTQSLICPGFTPPVGTICISYAVRRGVQASYHESPGQIFHGTQRTAYLPSNLEGRMLLSRLIFAWSHGLTFAIGTSLTSGLISQVTWTSIHHKTSVWGGLHGFPDPNYIDNCNGSFDALGVPNADDCMVFLQGTGDVPVVPIATAETTRAAVLIPFPSMAPSLTAVEPSLPVGTVKNESFRYKAPSTLPTNGHHGLSPSGTLTIRTIAQPCPGFVDASTSAPTGTIELHFDMKRGIQKSYHPNPSVRYSGTSRLTYLPLNPQGAALLKRMVYAFQHGLVFDVGTSVTTHQPNVIVWSTTIPHKSALSGGGPFSFPDPLYVQNCNQALDALGIPAAQTIVDCKLL